MNVKHFVNLSEDYLLRLQQVSDSPNTKIRPALSASSIKKWTEIIALIPKDHHVYLQQSFKQLKGIQRDYQDWVDEQKKNEEYEAMPEDNGDNVKVSAQGFEGYPDFPTVMVKVKDDEAELK